MLSEGAFVPARGGAGAGARAAGRGEDHAGLSGQPRRFAGAGEDHGRISAARGCREGRYAARPRLERAQDHADLHTSGKLLCRKALRLSGRSDRARLVPVAGTRDGHRRVGRESDGEKGRAHHGAAVVCRRRHRAGSVYGEFLRAADALAPVRRDDPGGAAAVPCPPRGGADRRL